MVGFSHSFKYFGRALHRDDHLVFQIVDKKPNRPRNPFPDDDLIQNSRKRYDELNLPRASKKAFDKHYSFKAWGTEVCSSSGRVGGPLKRLRHIEELTVELV